MENQTQDLVAIVNLTDKEFDIYQKENYSFPIELIKLSDLLKIKPSVNIIISDKKTDTNEILDIIESLKEQDATIILFSNKKFHPKLDNAFILNYESFLEINMFLKQIDDIYKYQMFPKDCFIDLGIQDIFRFITETKIEKTEIEIYKKENIPLKEALDIVRKDFENDERKFKDLLISIETDEEVGLIEIEHLISNIKDIIGVEGVIFQICVNEKMDDKVNLKFIISYN